MQPNDINQSDLVAAIERHLLHNQDLKEAVIKQLAGSAAFSGLVEHAVTQKVRKSVWLACAVGAIGVLATAVSIFGPIWDLRTTIASSRELAERSEHTAEKADVRAKGADQLAGQVQEQLARIKTKSNDIEQDIVNALSITPEGLKQLSKAMNEVKSGNTDYTKIAEALNDIKIQIKNIEAEEQAKIKRISDRIINLSDAFDTLDHVLSKALDNKPRDAGDTDRFSRAAELFNSAKKE